MKSAYELAMDRLSKSAPEKKLSTAQKAEIAEIESVAVSRIAQAELALKAALDAARLQGDFLEEDECRRRYGIDRARSEEEREVKRERVRSGG